VSGWVNHVLLYRERSEWRRTVGTDQEIACGALSGAAVSEPFEVARTEFAGVLHEYWGVDDAIQWQEIRPDWWGADLVPGGLSAAGEVA
jgi:hypothetical protein